MKKDGWVIGMYEGLGGRRVDCKDGWRRVPMVGLKPFVDTLKHSIDVVRDLVSNQYVYMYVGHMRWSSRCKCVKKVKK